MSGRSTVLVIWASFAANNAGHQDADSARPILPQVQRIRAGWTMPRGNHPASRGFGKLKKRLARRRMTQNRSLVAVVCVI
jgi:hypothetical protein